MKCKSCGASILFFKTKNGKSMPVDETPERRIVLIDGVAHSMKTYKPHWSTCNEPDRFRRQCKPGS